MSTFKRARILYVNHTGHVSGAERVLIDTLRILDRERYEPIVMCPIRGSLAKEIFAVRAEWLPLPSVQARFAWRPDRMVRSAISILKAAWTVRKRVGALAPDLIHANSVRAGLIAALATAWTRTPVIWHVHDMLPLHPASTALRLFVQMTPNTRVVAVSRAAAKRFRGRFPIESKVGTIHNGVDLCRFSPNATAGMAFREELGISKDEFLICAVGQICRRKGLLELIGALRRIRGQVPQMHLAIVGKVVFHHEEEYHHAIRRAVVAWGLEDRVHFCGKRHDVSPVLQASDLLVLNSRDEPFGLVLVEAMASGTPVLAARVGGIPEIVTDGENGWLVEPGDTAALASRLLQLSSSRDELRCAADHARRITCPRFSLDRYQSQLTALYSELISRQGAGWRQEARSELAGSGNH